VIDYVVHDIEYFRGVSTIYHKDAVSLLYYKTH